MRTVIDASEAHIGKLMDAITIAPGHEIERIDIWWTGKRWLVVDGHHRLKAYGRLQRDPKKNMKAIRVPVRVFEGTLRKAIARSVEGNSKDKLPMSEEEKSDAAWLMVCMGGMTKPEIIAASSRGDATVARMRRTRKAILKMIEAGTLEGVTEEQLINHSWWEAQMMERGDDIPEKDEDWVERQAVVWAGRLGRYFKDKLSEAPDVFARAIAIYSKELPGRMIESPVWGGYREKIEELEAWEREQPSDF